MHRPVLVTPPAILPVSLAEAKLHLHVDHSDDDALIAGLIAAATDHLDGWTGILGRCLVEQSWRQDFERFASCLPLPLGPVIDIVSAVIGADPVDQASYALKTDAGGRAGVEFNGVSISGPVSITYRAGYANTPEVPADGETPAIPAKTTVPAAIKTAIMLMVGNWYQNSEAVNVGNIVNEMPFGVAALIAPYRRIGV